MSQAELEFFKAYLSYLKNFACLQAKSLKAYKKDMKLTSNISSSSGSSQPGILGVTTVFLKSNYEYAVSFDPNYIFSEVDFFHAY